MRRNLFRILELPGVLTGSLSIGTQNMELKKVQYSELNSRQREIFNFQKVAGLLADYGFNCIKLADDWQGADFLAYHKDGTNTLKVQLKSRLCISKKYISKSLFMAFPVRGAWHLVEHDVLVQLVEKHTSWLTSLSWCENDEYTSGGANSALLDALSDCRL